MSTLGMHSKDDQSGPNYSAYQYSRMDELKQVVFSMNSNSAAGPEGMNWYFFQKILHIIENDLMEVIQAFFNGQTITKYFYHSCIVQLPKVSNLNKITEFRPIRQIHFTSKIISKLLSNILSQILNSLISPNKSGFVKFRSISENNMLAQEIIQQIKKPNIGRYVITKLDMEKLMTVFHSHKCVCFLEKWDLLRMGLQKYKTQLGKNHLIYGSNSTQMGLHLRIHGTQEHVVYGVNRRERLY